MALSLLLLPWWAGCGSGDGDEGAAAKSDGGPWVDSGGKAGTDASDAGSEGTGDASSDASPPGCDPPNSVEIGGQCVPSCGAAGGNQCLTAESTLCEGLPAIESYDCVVCCNRPEYPAPTPASFHFVDAAEPSYWDAILAMASQNPAIVFVGQNKPPEVGPEHWAAYLSYRDTPQPTAPDINQLLIDPATAPRFVMVEELHDAESEAFFVALASEMKSKYPQWAGRWGAFITFGNYPLLSVGIDALLQADAVFALELYPKQSEYCNAGSNGGARDIWLGEQFSGNATLGRLNWLWARRQDDGSASFITPVFGVGDVLLDGQNPAAFLDRMFYVWVTRSNFPGMIAAQNGGPGAYKWQPVEKTPQKYGVGNTSRDLAFSQSYDHYSLQGLTTSLKGPVPCP